MFQRKYTNVRFVGRIDYSYEHNALNNEHEIGSDVSLIVIKL